MSWKVVCSDCVDHMRTMPDNSVDLTVTSPPYDRLRSYGEEDILPYDRFEVVADELYRVTCDGGVVVWVSGDQTIDGSETGTSFRQALRFKDAGFLLHDTMIYQKVNPVPNAGRRYQQEFEYMFVLSKGKPKTANIMLEKRRNTCNDRRTQRVKSFSRDRNGEFGEPKLYKVREYVPRRNIWAYKVGKHNTTGYEPAFEHPAVFPEKLAEDHILSWSGRGDLVLDPFCGSGTTGSAAVTLGRSFVGIDVNSRYCEIAVDRIKAAEDELHGTLWSIGMEME